MKRWFPIVVLLGCEGATAQNDAALPTQDSGANDASVLFDPNETCDAPTLPALDVAISDLYGYPPYAIDGCQVAYISSSGALRMRSLKTGIDAFIESPSMTPRRPSLKDGTLAWEATVERKSVVRVRLVDGQVMTMSGQFDHAGEPRLGGNALVFTAWVGSQDSTDTNIVLYDLLTKSTQSFDAAGQQRFADVSDALVTYADFAEDPDGRFDGNETDLADITVYDRVGRTIATRKREGKQAFARIANSSSLIYLHWNAIHPEPKLSKYSLCAGAVAADASLDQEISLVENQSAQSYILPSVRGDLVEWIGFDSTRTTRLWRSRFDVPSPTVVAGLEGFDLSAPASNGVFTLLAVRKDASVTPSLRLVAR